MLAVILGIGAILIVAVAIFFLKKRQETQKVETRVESASIGPTLYKSEKPQAYRATLSLEEKDHAVRPENNQQRNLDREVGGLEEGKKRVDEKEEQKEKIVEDAWDKRSEDVDKMGSFNPLAGDDKESMIWRLKKIRMKIGKHLNKEHDNKDNVGTHFDSRQGQVGGFSQMIKARQDFGNEHDGGGMGR